MVKPESPNSGQILSRILFISGQIHPYPLISGQITPKWIPIWSSLISVLSHGLSFPFSSKLLTPAVTFTATAKITGQQPQPSHFRLIIGDHQTLTYGQSSFTTKAPPLLLSHHRHLHNLRDLSLNPHLRLQSIDPQNQNRVTFIFAILGFAIINLLFFNFPYSNR